MSEGRRAYDHVAPRWVEVSIPFCIWVPGVYFSMRLAGNLEVPMALKALLNYGVIAVGLVLVIVMVSRCIRPEASRPRWWGDGSMRLPPFLLWCACSAAAGVRGVW